jgi:hypothetical protein
LVRDYLVSKTTFFIEQWKKLQHHQHQQYAEAIGDAHIQ